MKAEIAALAVAIDQWREHLVRQRRRQEARGLPQAVDQRGADFLGQRVPFWQLQVVLGLGRLVAGSHLAIGPVSLLQGLANTGQFVSGEQAWDVQQHGKVTVGNCKGPMILIPFCATQAFSPLTTIQPNGNLRAKCKDCKFFTNGNESQLLVTIAYISIRRLITLGKVSSNAPVRTICSKLTASDR